MQPCDPVRLSHCVGRLLSLTMSIFSQGKIEGLVKPFKESAKGKAVQPRWM